MDRKCEICHFLTNTKEDVFRYGKWMRIHGTKYDFWVHYFCLLLSTNLPQRGAIRRFLGFQGDDIRKEIRAASERECCYCGKCQASVRCRSCKVYFHLLCGERNDALFQFVNEFKSYCDKCVPLDEFERKTSKDPPGNQTRCYICMQRFDYYTPVGWIYAPCCSNGFVHRSCMLQYAYRAGYYLKCIWCKNIDFREQIRLHGIFVPDRDAEWELEKGAYRDLHQKHNRCDMETCLCKRGRDFISGKWPIILCELCGSFGAHNPFCITGKEMSTDKVSHFKCDTCSAHEKANKTLANTTQSDELEEIDITIYMQKHIAEENKETPSFSGDDYSTSISSVNTVIQCTVSPTSLDSFHSNSPMPPNLHAPTEKSDTTILDLCTPSPIEDNNTDTSWPGSTLNKERTTHYAAADPSQDDLQIDEHLANQSLDESTSIIPFFLIDGGMNCTGTGKARINLLSPRFAGKTLNEIQRSEGLITNEDVIETSDDLGIFAELNRILDEYVD